jgi:hypothetical protein
MPCARLVAVVVDGRLWTGVGQLALRNNVVVEVSASLQLGACVAGGSTPRSVEHQAVCGHGQRSTFTDVGAGSAGPRIQCLHIYAPAAHHPQPSRPGAPCAPEPAWMLLTWQALHVWISTLQHVASGAACSHPPQLLRLPAAAGVPAVRPVAGCVPHQAGPPPAAARVRPAGRHLPPLSPGLVQLRPGCLITSPPVRFFPGCGVDSMVECFVCTSSSCVWGLVAYARTCGSASVWPSTRQPVQQCLPACWQRCSEGELG